MFHKAKGLHSLLKKSRMEIITAILLDKLILYQGHLSCLDHSWSLKLLLDRLQCQIPWKY